MIDKLWSGSDLVKRNLSLERPRQNVCEKDHVPYLADSRTILLVAKGERLRRNLLHSLTYRDTDGTAQ